MQEDVSQLALSFKNLLHTSVSSIGNAEDTSNDNLFSTEQSTLTVTMQKQQLQSEVHVTRMLTAVESLTSLLHILHTNNIIYNSTSIQQQTLQLQSEYQQQIQKNEQDSMVVQAQIDVLLAAKRSKHNSSSGSILGVSAKAIALEHLLSSVT